MMMAVKPRVVTTRTTVQLGVLWGAASPRCSHAQWLAVHPNVPGRNITTKGAISCAIERAKIIAITILAPEVILAWAAEQFTVAWKLRHGEYFHVIRSCLSCSQWRLTGKYTFIASATQPSTEQMEELKLTLAHGFLLSMGGFYYTPQNMKSLINHLKPMRPHPPCHHRYCSTHVYPIPPRR